MNRLILGILLVTFNISVSQNTTQWTQCSIDNTITKNKQIGLPLKHLFKLDFNSLKTTLKSSPKRTGSKSNAIISLPDGDGNFEILEVYENSVMDPELEVIYPEIKSYIAIGVENPQIKSYLSISPLGFKSMTIYPDKQAVFIDAVSIDVYTVYRRTDNETPTNKFECITECESENISQPPSAAKGADDGILRTYRMALSCTGEYARLFGGTKILALSGMNNTITRINGIFERDFGAKFIIISNNDAVIYTDPLTDPYSDPSAKPNWRSELKTNLNNVIGLPNYDIGHLFGANSINVSSGDAGCIGCVCTDFNKGSGYSCANPKSFSGDSFDIDLVAHEMGHQLGANHTYSHVTESSSGAQMEPGSGSTIMSYAGSTSKDVQNFSDAYFHAISIQQVTDNIKTKTCGIISTTGNSIPIVNAGPDCVIPKGTPFLLTGSAIDGNADDMLTYCWEEMDLGSQANTVPSITATTGPLFRSYNPSSSPTRYFPNMTTILAGSVTTSSPEIPTEVLPGVNRTLNFRLTVRDNRMNGSANNTDDAIINVDGNAGPFTVDSQNSVVSYKPNSIQTVTWSVAGTNINSINCASVDIILSTDGGKSFPITLLSAAPNTGAATIIIPNIVGTTNRIMIKGTNQIFFDVNNVNFIIADTTIDTVAPSTPTLSISGTTTSGTNLSWTTSTDNVGVIGYNVYQNNVLKTTTTSTSLVVTGLSPSTLYNFYVVAKDAIGNLSVASNIVSTTTLPIIVVNYCVSNGLSTSKEYINKVQIGSINNTSGNNNGYKDFTLLSTDLVAGSSNTITITPAWNGSIMFETYSIWIDLNRDKDFNDIGELIYSKTKTKTKPIVGYVNIPANTLPGITRMRVSMKNNLLSSACEIFSYGEVEDYSVNIIEYTIKYSEEPLAIKLYPNPVVGDVINFSNLKGPTNFSIFNLMGQEIKKDNIENEKIYVQYLKPGLYLIKIKDSSSTNIKTFIKQ